MRVFDQTYHYFFNGKIDRLVPHPVDNTEEWSILWSLTLFHCVSRSFHDWTSRVWPRYCTPQLRLPRICDRDSQGRITRMQCMPLLLLKLSVVLLIFSLGILSMQVSRTCRRGCFANVTSLETRDAVVWTRFPQLRVLRHPGTVIPHQLPWYTS